MNYYTICPICGHKILKADEGSRIEMFCPKCRQKLVIEIKDSILKVYMILSDNFKEEIGANE